jgi:hypothetical protein
MYDNKIEEGNCRSIRVIKSRKMRWVGQVAHMGDMRNACTVLLAKQEGKISFGRQRQTWKDNIKMDLEEIGYEVVVWFHLAQDRDHWWAPANMVKNLWVP